VQDMPCHVGTSVILNRTSCSFILYSFCVCVCVCVCVCGGGGHSQWKVAKMHFLELPLSVCLISCNM
jgi:hypothetical protein